MPPRLAAHHPRQREGKLVDEAWGRAWERAKALLVRAFLVHLRRSRVHASGKTAVGAPELPDFKTVVARSILVGFERFYR